jgi:uncharacterized protein YrzB (UPF0473 family)
MGNKITIDRENGETITVDIILGFEIEELNKKYIAYTLNDNGEDEDVDVLISEVENNKLKSIPDEEINIVLEYYNEAKELVEN